MKKLPILVALLVLLFVSRFYLLKNNSNLGMVTSPTPKSTPPSMSADFCKPSDLESQIMTEGAAGNIFGTLTIKNISDKNCKITGSNFTTADYNAKNLKVVDQGNAGAATIKLAPNQTAYSQIHYPNGPQCSSALIQIPISYSYKISSTDSAAFISPDGTPNQIGICDSIAEVTNVDVWSISVKPVNQ